MGVLPADLCGIPDAEVSDDGFTASLADVTLGSRQEVEEADFDINDVGDGDRELVQPGAIFRWVIGYQKGAGSKIWFSRVVFRRLPAWSKKDIETKEKRSVELAAAASWD